VIINVININVIFVVVTVVILVLLLLLLLSSSSFTRASKKTLQSKIKAYSITASKIQSCMA